MPQCTQSTVKQALSELRAQINGETEQISHVHLLDLLQPNDQIKWEQLCASLDAIGDCDLAIQACLLWTTIDKGELYLRAYGLLQVLFVQQDALQHAAEAVGMSYQRPQDLKDVRDVRNDAAGHPTKRGQSHSFGIVRRSLTHEKFTLVEFSSPLCTQFEEHSFQVLIDQQTPHIVAGLRSICQHIASRWQHERSTTPEETP